MPYSAFASAGSDLQVEITSVFQSIPGAEGIDGPTGSKEQIEVTALKDTAKKFVAGLPDYGEVTFNLFWDPADSTHQYLLTSYQTANKTEKWKIIASDAGAATAAFDGQVTGFKWSFQKGAAATVAVTIKVSGNVTVTP
jgi:hypothetical protein